MDLSQQRWIALEKVLVEFDRLRAQGAEQDIEQFIRSDFVSNQLGSEIDDTGMLLELVQIDLEYQWKKGGNEYTSDHYLSHFPQLADPARHRWTIIEAELTARTIANRMPDDDEVKRRFGDDASRIRILIESLEDQARRSTVTPDACRTICMTPDQIPAPPVAKPASGDLIGHYRLLEKVGSGTFSTVWSANDEDLKRLVAVKILRPEQLSDTNIVRRMMREARAAAQLEHPSIIRVHEVGNHEGLPYIVTQLVKGPTLQELLEARSFSHKQTATIVREVANGIHYAHRDGIVHRDIKPANILMDSQTRPMIADFGLASRVSQTGIRMTHAGDILGTPAYMSPEQASGDNHVADLRTDVYSIGVILYRMLTGKLPFKGRVSSVIHQVIHDTPPAPRTVDASIERDFETITMKCLEKSPQDRYQSAAAVARDLTSVLDGEPISARPVGVIERTFRWGRKRPRTATLLAFTAVLCGFLIGSRFQLNAVQSQNENSKVLLAQTERDAGRLAMQRGQYVRAVEHFDRSSAAGGMESAAEKLEFVESLFGTNETRKVAELLKEIGKLKEISPPEKASSVFWNAMVHLDQGENDQALRLFEDAVNGDLNPSDRKFAQAMLSPSTPDAARLMLEAIAHDSLNHHARRTLLWLMFSLSDFDSLERQLEIADNLFPDDDDFTILRAMYVAADQDPRLARKLISESGLEPDQKKLWKRACAACAVNLQNLSHSPGNVDFDELAIRTIIESFETGIWPAMKSRGLHFPPKIVETFKEFADALSESNGQHLAQDAIEELTRLTDIHPECSLILALAGQHMGRNELRIALELGQRAQAYRGFVEDTRRTAIETVSTCSLVLIHEEIQELGPDSDVDPSLYETFVSAVEKFETEPALIEKYTTQKSGTPVIQGLIHAVSVQACDDGLILKWLSRMEAAGEAKQSELLWIKTIVAIRTESWFRVIELCNLQLEMADQGLETVDVEQIRNAREGAEIRLNDLDFVESGSDKEDGTE